MKGTIRRWRAPRKKILESGGVTEVNTSRKIYLCFFGAIRLRCVPAIPPEIVFVPGLVLVQYLRNFLVVAPLILVPTFFRYAKKPFKKIPDENGSGRTVRGRARHPPWRLHWWEEPDFVAEFLPGGSTCVTYWFQLVLHCPRLKQAETGVPGAV